VGDVPGGGVVTVARSKNADKNACDELFRRIVRARGRCEHPDCDRTDVVTAHILGRRFAKIRTNELNAWALCPSHHWLVDNWPDEKIILVNETIGFGTYQALRREAEDATGRFDWAAERVRLKALLAAVSA
jgi:hypothetical protein